MVPSFHRLHILIALAFLFGSGLASAKERVRTVNISSDLMAKIHINESNPEARWKLRVMDKKSRQLVAQVDADPVISLDEELFVMGDFNFDGTEDLAVMDGHKSCYGGPTYTIFLGQKNQSPRFRRSPALTELAQNGCGLFKVDADAKTIEVSNKSGCCTAMETAYALTGDKPVLVRQKDLYSGVAFHYPAATGEKPRNPVIRLWSESDPDAPREWFSFKLKNRNARVLVFAFYGDLKYALINAQGGTEFLYPGPGENRPRFKQRRLGKRLELDFANPSATYRVYRDGDSAKVGVIVTAAGKTQDLQGETTSIQGDLAQILEGPYSNLDQD